MAIRNHLAQVVRFGQIALAGLLLATRGAGAEDLIVLRPQSPLRGKQVERFDEDGVKMVGMARPFGWEDIASGRVDHDQTRFDALLKEVGEPLYQIRQGLRAGDYRALLEPSRALFPRYVGRRSAAAYMVGQALMWARLALGQREAALEPYLVCLDILRTDRDRASLPGSRRLRWDAATGMSPELAPLWFDRDAASAALPGVKKVLTTMSAPIPPGAYIYAATLASAAHDLAASETYLARIGDASRGLADLVQVVKAQQQIARGRSFAAIPALEAWLNTAVDVNKPLIRYTIGLARAAQPDERGRKDGAIDLLSVAALYGDEQPDLAAASLDQARRTLLALHDDEGARKLGDELVAAFPDTYHGARLKAERASKGRAPAPAPGP